MGSFEQLHCARFAGAEYICKLNFQVLCRSHQCQIQPSNSGWRVPILLCPSGVGHVPGLPGMMPCFSWECTGAVHRRHISLAVCTELQSMLMMLACHNALALTAQVGTRVRVLRMVAPTGVFRFGQNQWEAISRDERLGLRDKLAAAAVEKTLRKAGKKMNDNNSQLLPRGEQPALHPCHRKMLCRRPESCSTGLFPEHLFFWLQRSPSES